MYIDFKIKCGTFLNKHSASANMESDKDGLKRTSCHSVVYIYIYIYIYICVCVCVCEKERERKKIVFKLYFGTTSSA